MTGGAEIATDSDDAGHAAGELIAGKYTLLHPLDATLGTWIARCDAGPTPSKAIFALHLLRFPPSRVDAAAAFERELQKVEALAHPNLLCPLDHGAHGDGELYVGYEWLKARTLAQTLRDEWPLSDARVVSIMTQLLAALAAVHAAGLAHGDVKPSNLLLVPASDAELCGGTRGTRGAAGDHVLLRGLGLAEFSPYRCALAPPEQLEQIMAEWVVGDPDYAAPEQLAGELPSARSDVYTAGILLFQLLTRTVPFTARSAHEVAFMQRFAPPAPPSAYALVNPTLEAICLRALSKTPDLRFQSAGEMQAALIGSLAEPEPITSGAELAFERARAQLARVSSVALAPAVRASSTALLPVARAGGAALSRARVHVARISSAALAPITRAGVAASTSIFRADALSAAPVETRAGLPGRRSFAPLLALAALGLIAAASFWPELQEPESEPVFADTDVPAAAPSVATEEVADVSHPPPAAQVASELVPPDGDSPVNADPPLALEGAIAARPLGPSDPAAPELEPVTHEADSPANAQSAEAPGGEPVTPPAPQTQTVLAKREQSPRAQPPPAARLEATTLARRTDLRAQSRPRAAEPRPSAAASAVAASAPKKGSASQAQLALATAPVPAANPLALVPQASPPRALPPTATKRAGDYYVELGDPVTSRRSVSKGALRGALNADALARCYRDAMAPLAEPSALHATLELTTDLSGRVRSAHLRGKQLEPELVQCVESQARRSRVREGDSSGAMQAAIALTFRAL